MNFYLVYGFGLLLTGLSAGLFYSYQCSVIGGLGSLPTREYLLSFHGINKAILNPVFFTSFMGSPLALILTLYLAYRNEAGSVLPYLVTALIIYGVGVLIVTIAGNIPLNNALAGLTPGQASIKELEQFRLKFESKWNQLNLVRTIAATLSFAALIIPCMKKLAADV